MADEDSHFIGTIHWATNIFGTSESQLLILVDIIFHSVHNIQPPLTVLGNKMDATARDWVNPSHESV